MERKRKYSHVVEPRKLTLESYLQFRCHTGVSCFTKCCNNIKIFLTPYDILRIKNRLKLSSDEFLLEYTVPEQIHPTSLPVAALKMKAGNSECPFVTPEGCTIYDDRPAICRYYPIGMAILKKDDTKSSEEFFILIREKHCKGFYEDTHWTIKEWREDQGVDVHDSINSDWMKIILKAKSLGQVVFSDRSLKLFFMISTNLDQFKSFVFESDFLKLYNIDAETLEKIRNDDIALLKFGLAWLRFVLFGEGDFEFNKTETESRLKFIKKKKKNRK